MPTYYDCQCCSWGAPESCVPQDTVDFLVCPECDDGFVDTVEAKALCTQCDWATGDTVVASLLGAVGECPVCEDTAVTVL